MSLSKKISLITYSLALVLLAVSPFYFINKQLNKGINQNNPKVLGTSDNCSCDCAWDEENNTWKSHYCGKIGSKGSDWDGSVCKEIEIHCNAEWNGSSCNKNHPYDLWGSETPGSCSGGGGGDDGGTCNISSCADAGGKVCHYGQATNCSDFNESTCHTHAGSDCYWDGSSCGCDPNQGNVGGEGACGFTIEYSNSHACGQGSSASLTATIKKNDPSNCNQEVVANIVSGSFECAGEDYADGSCRTCGGSSGGTPVTIPANEGSKQISVSCNVPNNCGSCQVDINGTGTLVYDNSGCTPEPTTYTVGGRAYCVIKATGQKEYKGGIDISLGGTKIATTDGSGSWSATKQTSELTNTYIRPNGGSNFPNASATDQSTGVANGIGCTDSNVEATTVNEQNNQIIESAGCGRTLQMNDLNFNLGYCPIPDCTGLSGPTTLTVGQPAIYSVSFSQSVPNAKVTGVGISVINGSLSQGTETCDINGQQGVAYLTEPANSSTSTNSFEWVPLSAGTYSIYGRIWNNQTTECKAACIDTPPRYECQSASSCIKEVIVEEPETPLPNFSCNDLKMSFENASGSIDYNEENPNIPRGYAGKIILTCTASSDSTTKIDKVKFQLTKEATDSVPGTVLQGETTDIRELTGSGETSRRFEAKYEFLVDGKGTYTAESLACITFQNNESCK